MLFSRLKTFLSGLSGPEPDDDGAFAADDPRLATVALLIHIIDADGERKDVEMASLRDTITDGYDLDANGVEHLIGQAEKAVHNSADLYAFTRVIEQRLPHDQRQDLVETMWETVYADRQLHELEDHVLWRIAELIGIDREQRVALRRRVQERLGIDRTGADLDS